MKLGYIWPSGFREAVVRKCGRMTKTAYPISSPGAIGSEELKISSKSLEMYDKLWI